MALTIRLDDETQSTLSHFMHSNNIATSSKAIIYMINNFSSLQNALDTSDFKYSEKSDEFDSLIQLLKNKTETDEMISCYLCK